MNQPKKAYGLLTAVAMIIGIVVGSGIHFKADDILTYTGGSLALGLLVLSIGASNIVFGSLSLSEFAKLETSSGGVVAYLDRFISSRLATGYGWFLAFVMIPSVVAVVSWASAIYTGLLFNLDLNLGQQVLLGLAYTLFFMALNVLSRVLGGYFQTLTMFIKMVPLALIVFAGLFWSAPAPNLPAGVSAIEPSNVGLGWLSALVPLAFTYEGWNYVVTIAPELKHPKRDLIRAFIIGPLIILLTYLLFFYGMVRILGATFVLSTGDQAITYALTSLLGERAGNLILVVVIISMLGVLNGLLLAGMRLPQAYAEKGMLPKGRLEEIHPKYQVSVPSAILFTAITLVWLLIHYLTQKFGIMGKGDVSEITIVFNYIFYIILYLRVIKLNREGLASNRLTSLFAPVMGIIGAALVIGGSLISSLQTTLVFSLLCALVILTGWLYSKRQMQN